MIATHSLSADAFTALARGAGERGAVGQLREAQLSKHLMLLHVVAEAAGSAHPSQATAAFHAGYRLLAQAQAADPGAVAGLVGRPHFGSWAHDCVACLDEGSTPDFGYLASAAAAIAVQLGVPFELDVPVRDGRVLLPGLGCLQVLDRGEWAGLSSDGRRLRAGRHIDLACASLVPDDGSGAAVPYWSGTPLIRAVTRGRTWEVLLETADRHLDRYTSPMHSAMTAAEITNWRKLIQAAWELLAQHHEWAAGPLALGVPVIVPLVSGADLDSATSPAAFGAIATSVPPSPVSMAEILIHEFQHSKLWGLMDMLPLVEPSGERGYAPWREDPRPMTGILHGLYAFTGIVRFWNVQRGLETRPDDILRASVLYERWRLAIELVVRDQIAQDALTPAGARFVTMLGEQGQQPGSKAVPDEAVEIAREVALDNWLTWQLRHTALDAAEVARLAAAFQRGEPLRASALPETRIEGNVRKVDSAARSGLLALRYQDPARYRRLSAAHPPGLDLADAFLVGGNAAAAVVAYREALAAEPDPAAWIGLALAVHRLPAMASQPALSSRLPLLFEMHSCLANQGTRADPLDLASWFA